jgi:hypothetical protein
VRKVLKYFVGIAALVGLAAFAYHAASPKVVLTNLSGTTFEELVVNLPGSRVSFGPIPPQAYDTIYFSRQDNGGTVIYSLRDEAGVVAAGAVEYSASGQLFRVISVTIKADGSVSVTVSG